MNRFLKPINLRTSVLLLSLLLIPGCESFRGLFNPFVGRWESGILTLNFEPDSTFSFKVGETISINLEGTYDFGESTLRLNFENGSSASFTYEFTEDANRLALKPEGDFKYIQTEIVFEKR